MPYFNSFLTSFGSPEESAWLGWKPSYDCSVRVCPFGPSWADLPQANNTVAEGEEGSLRKNTDRAHRQAECSNAGTYVCMCLLKHCTTLHFKPPQMPFISNIVHCSLGAGKCEEGICVCDLNHRGSNCGKRTCPGKGGCSGHGKCVSMSVMGRMSDALPLSDINENRSDAYYTPGGNIILTDSEAESSYGTGTWDQLRNFGCVCDSTWPVGLGKGETQEPEWFGSDCSNKRCPTGNNPNTDSLDETDCSLKLAAGGRGTGKVGNLCHVDCSGKGTCDYKTGTCKCFIGAYGDNCGLISALAAGG